MKKLLFTLMFVGSLAAMESDDFGLEFNSVEELIDFLLPKPEESKANSNIELLAAIDLTDCKNLDDIVKFLVKQNCILKSTISEIFKKSYEKLENECFENNVESIKALRDLKKACRDSNYKITSEVSIKKLADYNLIDDKYNPKSEVKALVEKLNK